MKLAFASSIAAGGTDLLKEPFGSGKPSSLVDFAPVLFTRLK